MTESHDDRPATETRRRKVGRLIEAARLSMGMGKEEASRKTGTPSKPPISSITWSRAEDGLGVQDASLARIGAALGLPDRILVEMLREGDWEEDVIDMVINDYLGGGGFEAVLERRTGLPLTYVSRNIEDTPLKELRDDEILAYLARRAAQKNPDSPHYRPDQE